MRAHKLTHHIYTALAAAWNICIEAASHKDDTCVYTYRVFAGWGCIVQLQPIINSCFMAALCAHAQLCAPMEQQPAVCVQHHQLHRQSVEWCTPLPAHPLNTRPPTNTCALVVDNTTQQSSSIPDLAATCTSIRKRLVVCYLDT